MKEYQKFKKNCGSNISRQFEDYDLAKSKKDFFISSFHHKYPYNFEFLGRPIVQYPQDIVAIQELIWEIKPDLIIETGIAHGGSLIFSSSLLCLLDIIEGKDPRSSSRKVLGIDIDIREHNEKAIKKHPLSFKLEMIQGSSVDKSTLKKVDKIANKYERILVLLDSNHTHEHVLKELNAYSKYVSLESYCIVFDTCIENIEKGSYPDRPWEVGNNPMTAINVWLPNNPDFIVDKLIDNKLMISVAPCGYLKKIK